MNLVLLTPYKSRLIQPLEGTLPAQQILWRITFDNPASVQYHNLIKIQDCVKAMSNSQNGAVLELFPDDLEIWQPVNIHQSDQQYRNACSSNIPFASIDPS